MEKYERKHISIFLFTYGAMNNVTAALSSQVRSRPTCLQCWKMWILESMLCMRVFIRSDAALGNRFKSKALSASECHEARFSAHESSECVLSARWQLSLFIFMYSLFFSLAVWWLPSLVWTIFCKINFRFGMASLIAQRSKRNDGIEEVCFLRIILGGRKHHWMCLIYILIFTFAMLLLTLYWNSQPKYTFIFGWCEEEYEFASIQLER